MEQLATVWLQELAEWKYAKIVCNVVLENGVFL